MSMKHPFGCKERLGFWEAKKLCSEALENYNALLSITKRAFAHMKTTQELYLILDNLEYNGRMMI